MTDILNAIETFESAAQRNGQLQTDRANALDLYLGKPLGNEVEGRSQVVSHDVADTIEWIKPTLLRTFSSGDKVVQFTPTGQEDVEQAEQETDYVNFVITQKNNWFVTAYVWFTDALMQKNGYVKAWWDTKEDVTKETYKGLSDDQFAFIAQDPEVEIIEHSEVPDDYAVQLAMQQIRQLPPEVQMQASVQLSTQPPKLHDCVVQKKKTYACAKYACLPPERCVVSTVHQDVDLEDSDFFEHWEWKTLSDLKQEGYKVPDDINGEAGVQNDAEEQARNLYNENFSIDQESVDLPGKRVKVRECWIKFDHDKDGIAELRHCVVVGQVVLLNEEADMIPVAALTPTIMPHRHTGRSVTDAVKDLQIIKSTLQRGFLDNVYLANNGRYAINEDQVNLDDMLTSRPGGVVRVKGEPGGAILPLVHQANFAPVLQAMEYIDTVKEGRTGVTKYNQGLDANSLNKTAHGISQIMSAAQARIDLIARVFAETGVKRLFSIIHAITLKNATKPEILRLREKFVPVDPRQWKKRYDMTISVGLGTSDKTQMIQQLFAIYTMQKELMPLGIAKPQNLYHTASKITQETGFKDKDAFFTDPGPNPFQPPQDPKAIEIQAKAQMEQDKLAQRDKEKSQEYALKDKAISGELALGAHDAMQGESPDQTLNKASIDQQTKLRQAQIDQSTKLQEAEIAQWAELQKAALQGAVQIQIARIKAAAKPAEGESNVINKSDDFMSKILETQSQLLATLSAPKRIVRGPDGRASGVEPVI